jgi:hypothetical protein
MGKRRGIDEIPRGDGGGRRGETGDALGWTGIEGQGLPTRRVLFTLREKERRCVFHGCANEGVARKKEEIRPDRLGRTRRSDCGQGRSDRSPYSTWQSDRSSLAVRPPATGAPETPLVFADLIHICTK